MQDINYSMDDLTGRQLEYLDIVNAAENEFKLDKTRENQHH